MRVACPMDVMTDETEDDDPVMAVMTSDDGVASPETCKRVSWRGLVRTVPRLISWISTCV